MEEAVKGLKSNLENITGVPAEAELLTPGTTARRILLRVGTLTTTLAGLVVSALKRSPMPVHPRTVLGEFRWSDMFIAIERDIYRELRQKFGGKLEGSELTNDMEGMEGHARHVLEARLTRTVRTT